MAAEHNGLSAQVSGNSASAGSIAQGHKLSGPTPRIAEFSQAMHDEKWFTSVPVLPPGRAWGMHGKDAMTELGWDEREVTMVRSDSSDVEPPPLPTLRPPQPGKPRPPGPKPLDLERLGVLPAKRYVSPLAITEVEGDERQTWSFLKVTLPLPMVRATQALPLVRVRRRRMIRFLPWVAAVTGALSGAALCWWLTLPKTPLVTSELGAARAGVTRSVSGFEVQAPAGAQLSVDGEDHGVVPEDGRVRIEGLWPGAHQLRFDGRPDHGVLERDVTLEGGVVADLPPVSL
jgi:hypothetical protein